ncbi:hypothetical protein [Nitrosopumilus sp.]|uniref:hypothetical protein n=1 Tax=Nitrosopumilus sp. TaxID=2024843 RepID=UPI00247B80C9|nr:hypothetical protein [Nitrosopumilus sp.]MCV0409245.1 hypothetical protein [Nitrosopumilus sp.]
MMTHGFRDELRQHVTVNTRFLILAIFAVSMTLFTGNYAYAQQSNMSEQTMLSEDLKNDPMAQNLLKKIEQTKKMIEDLQQKEYEQNQARENLERARDLSLENLNQDLKMWERLWEQHSSRNAFDSFVSNKPEHVQGVFWDQFEFKEQKVKAGRSAMNQVLANGGTMQAAKDAYNTAASTQRIELIEVNAQFNVKHNLADYEEQQLFNSTGQIHFSPYAESKLSEFYSDHKLQPNYILANPDDASISVQRSLTGNDVTQCDEGYVLVSRITSEYKTCVDEVIAETWATNNVPGIIIYNHDVGEISSDVKTNPATNCGEGYQVVYHLSQSEYQCVSDYAAKQMLSDDTAEIHTLIEYIHGKDKQKITADNIYEINQKILKINKDFSAAKKSLESEYQEMLANEEMLIKQDIRQVIIEYKSSPNFTREELSESISELNNAHDAIKEKIIEQRDTALFKLESEQKNKILDAVKGYEQNPDIKIDWNDYVDETPNAKESESKQTIGATTSKVSYEPPNNDFVFDNKVIRIDNVDIVNSFGQKLSNIKSSQILQVVADITNPSDLKQDFVYMLDIKDNKDNPIRPTAWVTGTLTAEQTFNVGLSWIPEESGEFTATISTGNSMESVSHVADIGIVIS